MIHLRLLSRPGCHLCEDMRARVDALLEGEPHDWEVVDVDSDEELARRWSDRIPVLFVGGRLFAAGSLPALETRARLLRAAGEGDDSRSVAP